MDDHVNDRLYNVGINEEELMPENDPSNASGCNERTLESVYRLINAALRGHEKRKIRRLIDNGCERVVFALFEQTNMTSEGTVHAPAHEATAKATVTAIFTRGVDEVPDDKTYKTFDSQNVSQGLDYHLLKS